MPDLRPVRCTFRHSTYRLRHPMDSAAVIQTTWVLLHRHLLDTKRWVFVAKMPYCLFHCLLHFRFRLNDVAMSNDDAKIESNGKKMPMQMNNTHKPFGYDSLFFGEEKGENSSKHLRDVRLINGIYRTPNRLINCSMWAAFRQQPDRLSAIVDAPMLQKNRMKFKLLELYSHYQDICVMFFGPFVNRPQITFNQTWRTSAGQQSLPIFKLFNLIFFFA